MLKTLALIAPFAVVVVTLINGLQGSRVMVGVLVFSLAIAGVALGAIFGPNSPPPDAKQRRRDAGSHRD